VVLGGTALAGGRFYLTGSIVGALVLQTLSDTILRAGVPSKYNLMVRALAVLAICLLQSPAVRQWMAFVGPDHRRRSAAP
jgi:simple sugar transport system permease protein